jgi:hypothetical protein
MSRPIVAQPLELRQVGDGDGAALEEGALGGAERLLQPDSPPWRGRRSA